MLRTENNRPVDRNMKPRTASQRMDHYLNELEEEQETDGSLLEERNLTVIKGKKKEHERRFSLSNRRFRPIPGFMAAIDNFPSFSFEFLVWKRSALLR